MKFWKRCKTKKKSPIKNKSWELSIIGQENLGQGEDRHYKVRRDVGWRKLRRLLIDRHRLSYGYRLCVLYVTLPIGTYWFVCPTRSISWLLLELPLHPWLWNVECSQQSWYRLTFFFFYNFILIQKKLSSWIRLMLDFILSVSTYHW